MKLSVSASRGGNAKTDCSFAFGVEGSAGGTPCPHALRCAFGEQDNGGGNAAGHTRIVPQFGPSVLSCISVFDRKKRRKSYFKITFCPAECLPSETKKGGNCPALVISPQRLSCYRGTFSPPSSSYSTTSPAASACAPFPSCALIRSAASRAV